MEDIETPILQMKEKRFPVAAANRSRLAHHGNCRHLNCQI